MPLKQYQKRVIPKVVKTLPSLCDVFKPLDEVEVKGVMLKVMEVFDDEVVFEFFPPKTTFVLDNGTQMDSDEWFKTYFDTIDEEVERESTGEVETDSIPQYQGGEGEAELLLDGDAGEREDDARKSAAEEID